MNLGFPEMLFLGLLALLLFGPKRLPEIGRQIGRAMGEFKRASSEFQNQLEEEVRQLEVQENSQRSIAPPAPPEGSIAQTASASSSSGGPAASPPLPGGDGAKGA
jgi:TatA/E family protein of Tat protein translocase